MRIVDAQMHEPPITLKWSELDLATAFQVLNEVQVAYMDSVGVDAALIFPVDIRWGAQLSELLPDRFKVVAAFAPGGQLKGFAPDGVISGPDPLAGDVEDQVHSYASKAWCVGLRMMDVRAFAEIAAGKTVFEIYDRALTACGELGLTVFMSTAGDHATPGEIARRYPDLTLVVDHLGMPQPPMRTRDSPPFRSLPQLLRLADQRNVVVKLSGAPTLSEQGYPYHDLWPSLRKIIDTFGPDRLMWGSDISRIDGRLGFTTRFAEARKPYQGRHNYGEALRYILDSDRVNDQEKLALLGGTAERVLSWSGPTRHPNPLIGGSHGGI